MLASYWDMLAGSAEVRAEDLDCITPDAFPDFSDVLETALAYADLPRTRAQCRHALDGAWKGRGELRFNKGTSGRGKTYFSFAHLERLARMLSFHPMLADYAAELL